MAFAFPVCSRPMTAATVPAHSPAKTTMRDNDDVKALAQADVVRALAEDVGTGDLTAGLIDPARRARARILAREAAIICGAPWAEAALRALDPMVQITWHVAEGQRCAPDQVVLELEGNARALLSAERTALNFLQLLSAVATKTRTYVDVVAGTRAHIVDTRKTLPGLRLARAPSTPKIQGPQKHEKQDDRQQHSACRADQSRGSARWFGQIMIAHAFTSLRFRRTKWGQSRTARPKGSMLIENPVG